MNTETQYQIAKVFLIKGTEAQKQEVLLFMIGSSTETQSSKSIWFLSDCSLEDGWYWRRHYIEDMFPDIVEVCNGAILDKEPSGDYRGEYVVVKNYDFQDYWFSGPIKAPE